MHISENDLILFLERKFTGKDKDEIENHLSECAECTSRLALIYSLIKETETPDLMTPDKEYFERAKALANRAGGKELSINKIPIPSMVFVLSFVFVAFLAVFFYFSSGLQGVKTNEYRGEPSGYYVKLFPLDGSILSAGSLSFSWNSIKNAVEYKVTIYDESGSIVFSKSLPGTVIKLNSKNYFNRGNTYLWNVIAYLPDGRSVKSSVHSFEFSYK